MLVVAIGLRKVPDGALWLVMVASAQDGAPCMLVEVLIGPLPHIAHHVHHTERARSLRMRIDIAGRKHHAALVGSRRWRILRIGAHGTRPRTSVELRC